MIDFITVGATIADITVLGTFIYSILLAYRRGLTILAFNLICMVITVFAVLIFCKPLTNLVYENTNIDEFFSKNIQKSIGAFLEEQIEKNGHINTKNTNIAKPVAEKINSYIDEVKDDSVSNISEYVADNLSYIVISAIVVVVLSIVVRLLTILLRSVLYFITKLPIISNIDKVGGVVYGVLRAYLIVYLVLAVLSLISPIISNTRIIACINNSKICKIFYNNNVFLNIFIQ